MHAPRASFWNTHRRTILALLFGLAFSAALAYAAPPGGGYGAGDTLNPDCAPGENDCIVQLPGGSSIWGSITGTLSDQTDLQDALDDKFDDPSGTTSQYIRGDGTLETSPIIYASSSYFGRSSGSFGSANIFIGDLAGGSTFVTQSNFLGPQAGYNAANASQSNFFGYNAGATAVNASYSNFFGLSAGASAENASFSNFLGFTAGSSATNATNSNFFGQSAGANATNANNSIFIGYRAGYNDSVNNSSAGTSILIGDSTSTGGFSNSIAIGKSATNTAANQFLIGSSYTQLNMRGINYTMPSSQAAAPGYVLTNNGSGVLSWTSAGSGGSVTLQTNNVTNGSQSVLNLFAGSNITLTDNGTGRVTIASSGGGGGVSSPITVENTSSLFSTELDAGTGSTAVDSIFLGQDAGTGATNASASNFFGIEAGYNAVDADNSNFLGNGAGYDSTAANFSNFFGQGAGAIAVNANNSNFLGLSAGSSATDANNSNFFGANAGANASNSNNSNFFGANAGDGASDANNSNFVGTSAGYQAYTASNSNFIGQEAGFEAFDANNSTFIGQSAGHSAVQAVNSNFFGQNAGYGASGSANSFFVGFNAGAYDIGASGFGSGGAANSIFIGANAGYFVADNSLDNTNSTDDYSILLGQNTSTGGFSNSIAIGSGAVNTAANQLVIGSAIRPIDQVVISGTSPYLNFTDTAGSSGYGFRNNSGNMEYKNNGGVWALIGSPITLQNSSSLFSTGLSGTGSGSVATKSFFVGTNAGSGATYATRSNFLGEGAGFEAGTDSDYDGDITGDYFDSNFFGYQAGYQATEATNSNFLGQGAGSGATSASFSNFFGRDAGQDAVNAGESNFFGVASGRGATNASNSSFIGNNAGDGAVNAAHSIFIGASAGSGDTVDNTTDANDYSILIGQGTSTGGFENSIAIGNDATNTASNQFMIGSSTRPIDSTVFIGTAGTSCTITTGTSMSCSSDERLKTNIEDLETDTLDKLLSVRTVSYNWNSRTDADPMVGFLAQDLEQYFPQLVTTGPQDYLQVNYAGMTPILVEAIREMNLKITSISDIDTGNSWRDALVEWFASASNNIGQFFAQEIHTDTICVKKSDGNEICLNGDQLESLTEGQGTIIINAPNPEVPEEVNDDEDTQVQEEPTPAEEESEVIDPEIEDEVQLEPEIVQDSVEEISTPIDEPVSGN